ncbi:hypothetical protein [Castellaniella sp.]|uniref:hypothetical protein n=1 Tax=Castellaniella sp. TaxID=1955812 RepID=UPI002AFE0CEE|nr:hypothetical protein [Castellaniella sp.]
MKKKRRIPRTIRIPVTRALRDEFAMLLYTSLWSLEHAPGADPFDNLAGVFNVVQLALEHDAAHRHEARLITGGAAALNQAMNRIISGKPPADHEIAPIRVSVETIDRLLGRLDVSVLYAAMQRLRDLRAAPEKREL